MSPLVYLTWILALGIVAQWLAWKFKFPSILLLLAFGFGFGRISGVQVDDYLAAGNGHGSPLLSVVGLFVAIILFEGGLTLKFRELKESGAPILRLCTLAVGLSFILTTLFMVKVLGYDVRIGALVGAILTVTGPTVITPLLRHMNPVRKMGSIVKWEGIVVDPVGAILAVFVFKITLAPNPTEAWMGVIYSFAVMITVGVLGAFLLAKGVELLLKHHLVPDYLQPVFLLALVAVAFTGSNLIEKESGLLTVTVLGITLANQRTVSVRHILEFKENLTMLIISSLFLILSGRVATPDLIRASEKGLWLIAFLVIIGRPVSVYVALLFSKKTSFKERTLLAFLAPRGIVAAAVTSVFALEIQEATARGIFGPALSPVIAIQSREIVALVFLVIIGTVTLYGLSAAPLARRLGLAAKNATGVLFAGADLWARLAAQALQSEGHQIMLLDTNFANVAAAKMLGLNAHRANILSDFAEEELDINGISHLVAGTPNDEVNSIAALRFIHQFGRAGVWQVAPTDREGHHTKAVADELRSRICFTGTVGCRDLAARVAAGAIMKKTQITEVFDFAQFQAAHPTAAILFLQDQKGLRPAPAELTKVTPGTSIYALVSPTAEATNHA